ncbi:A1 cistron-splicing factor [Xylariaceae sp. FL0594]|nr:A1 cistron-splicing factor [Xylariaceae sp. FL0594]
MQRQVSSNQEEVGGGGGEEKEVLFILQNLPANFTIGCDSVSFRSERPSFPGFRAIPPGPHFVWVSPQESTSSRCGYWIYAAEAAEDSSSSRRQVVHVKRWNGLDEVLQDDDDDDDAQQLAEASSSLLQKLVPFELGRLSRGGSEGSTASSSSSNNHAQGQQQQPVLAPHSSGSGGPAAAAAAVDRLTDENIWYQLTSAITPAVLDRIVGGAGNNKKEEDGKKPRRSWRVTTMESVAGDTNMASEARLYSSSSFSSSHSAQKTADAAELHFLFPMNEFLIDPSATGPERTRQALDPTAWVLRKIDSLDSTATTTPEEKEEKEKEKQDEQQLLGDLQFAFLTGVHLGNQSCLEQWFFLVTCLVLRCHDLVPLRPRLARALIQALHAQLVYNDLYIEGDVFDLSLSLPLPLPHTHSHTHTSTRDKLRMALITYRTRLDESETPTPEETEGVRTAFSTLESYLRSKGGGTSRWDLEPAYVRSGMVMLEDGEMVQLDLDDFEDVDERGEYAPAVVRLDEDGREEGSLSF